MSTLRCADQHIDKMTNVTEEEGFQLFSKLPVEIRLIIYGMALPQGRVHHLIRKSLKMTVGAWEMENLAMNREEIFHAAGYDSSLHCNGGLDELRIYKNEDTVQSPVAGPNAIPLVGFKSYHQAPALLFVCRESYECASKSYQPAFAAFGSVPQTYFNFEEDTLLLRSETFGVEPLHPGTFFWEDSYEKYYRGLSGLWGLDGRDDTLKVKHLAVEVCVEEFRDADDAECFISNLLKDFQKLETLTLVIEHYQGKGTDLSIFSFMDPLDLTGIRTRYEVIVDQATQRPQFKELYELPKETDFPHEHAGLIKCLRMAFIEESSRDTIAFKIPKIKCKISVTQEYRNDLEVLLTEGRYLVEKGNRRLTTFNERCLGFD